MRLMIRRVGVATAALGVLALLTDCGVAQARVQGEDQGRLIQIGPDRGADGERPRRGRIVQPGFREAPQVVSRYWIGVAGGPTPPEVRAHVRLDDGVGVMLRAVEPDSPAAEGGLEQYDIVTRADGDPVTDMRQLAEAVGETGERKGRLTLEIVRGGRPQTVWVTPSERPIAPADAPEGGLGWFGGFRGPQPFGFGELPGGVSISVTQTGDGPAKITVQRGEESWELDANDEEAIAALPEDVRPFVERAVGGPPAGDMLRGLLDGEQLQERFGLNFEDRLPGFEPGDLQRRMREMEEQVEALRRRFGGFDEDQPAFEPEGDVERGEVEIPAES